MRLRCDCAKCRADIHDRIGCWRTKVDTSESDSRSTLCGEQTRVGSHGCEHGREVTEGIGSGRGLGRHSHDNSKGGSFTSRDGATDRSVGECRDGARSSTNQNGGTFGTKVCTSDAESPTGRGVG